jgi:transcriptional regulator with XRE-family HTH domain
MSLDTSHPPQIGPVIQAERKARQLTLEQLAARSGVSKSMLSQIERGEANPTFAVLWGLTQALKIDFADLVAAGVAHRQAGTIELVSVAHTPEIRSPDGDWTLRILSPPALAGRMEWYEVEIAVGQSLASAPHAPGTIEHLTAWSGGLSVVSGDNRQPLQQGETARYRADLPHEIVNTGPTPAKALMVVLYE